MEARKSSASQQVHLGHWLGHALRKFDARVLNLMAADPQVPLALSNLARRNQIGAAHIHLTRHMPRQGARLSDLALSAGMSKQAMAKLLGQCEAWGLLSRSPHMHDARAVWLRLTPVGVDWLNAFERATAQAQAEFDADVSPAVATVVRLGLEVYAGNYDPPKAGKRR